MGRVARIFYPVVEQHANEKIFKWRRHHLSTLVKCITGHVELNKQEFRLKHIDSPLYLCGEEESADHFLLRCERFALARTLNLGSATITEQEAKYLTMQSISSFIRDTKRLKNPSIDPG